WICDISSGTKRNHTSLRNRRIEFMVNDRFQSLLRQPRFVQRKCEDREVTIEFSKQGIYGPLAIMFAFLGCVGVAVSLFNFLYDGRSYSERGASIGMMTPAASQNSAYSSFAFGVSNT